MDYKGDMRDISIKVPGVSLSDLNNMVITSGQKDFRLVEIAQISEVPDTAFQQQDVLYSGHNQL